ncbi:glutathione s-transferase zeta class [Quercus suber]|uniref:Glutathione s-transferase zeta class n=1 Tax=Quercus suber TaxID=58331 RepID=A0AAW0ITV8_QUESU
MYVFFFLNISIYLSILEFIKLNPIGNYLVDKYPHHYPLLPQEIHKRAINYQVLSTIYHLLSLLSVICFFSSKTSLCNLLTITLSTTNSGLYLYSCHFRSFNSTACMVKRKCLQKLVYKFRQKTEICLHC